jgi:hypothetical protein
MQNNLDTVFFKTIKGEISSVQFFASTLILSKHHLHLVKTGDNIMENILVQTSTKKKQFVFKYFLLKITVSNEFPFQ